MTNQIHRLTKEKADLNARQAIEKSKLDKEIADAKEQKRRECEREKAKKEKEKTSYDYYVEESKNYKDPLPERKMTLRELINELKKLLKEVEY